MTTTAQEVAALRATLEAKMKADDRDRREAKDQRDSMAKDVSAIRADATVINNRVENLENDMRTVKPVVAKVTGWHNRVIGGMIVLGLLGSAVTIFWEAVRDKLISMFAGG